MAKKGGNWGSGGWGIFYLETSSFIITRENRLYKTARASSPIADSPEQRFTTLKGTKKERAEALPLNRSAPRVP